MNDIEKTAVIREVIETYYATGPIGIKTRKGDIPKARHFFFYFCGKYTRLHDELLAGILKPYSPKRCAVVYARKTIRAWMETDKYIRMQHEDLEYILKDRLQINEN